MTSLGVLMLSLHLPGCTSLKEKRSRVKPLLARLHREFNVSAAEVESMDAWQEAGVACALVSNDARYTQQALEVVRRWVETDWPDMQVIDDQIELL
jgi:uncharacterized protein